MNQGTQAAERVEAIVPDAHEGRMQVRAYHYWLTLCDGCDMPSAAALEKAFDSEFAAHSVALRFRPGRAVPAIEGVGRALMEECGLDKAPREADAVPARSILSRLTDHALQVVGARAPVGFEAEFSDAADCATAYRGILLPFSSDGSRVDYAYGVINWRKELRKTAQILRLFG